MRLETMFTAILAVVLLGPIAGPAQAQGLPPDPARPAADLARDAARKPGAILAFARVRPGETVLEILPGGGYFTRVLSRAVGPTGHVLAASPPIEGMDKGAKAVAADPAYANVQPIVFDATALDPSSQVDLIFTAQNYHDLHLTRAHQDVPFLDKLFFGKLRSGGLLVIIDHAANAGAPVTETADTLHRIDPAVVRQEAEAAGFVFDGMTEVLRNPADTHMLKVFDPAIRGRTDQFAFRFRKP